MIICSDEVAHLDRPAAARTTLPQVQEGFMLRFARMSAYAIAVAGLLLTATLTLAAPQHQLLVAMMGGTLSAAPYMLARAMEMVVQDRAATTTLGAD